MRVAALTQGIKIPSSRFRIRQLIEPMSGSGVQITEFASAPCAYPPEGLFRRLPWAIRVAWDTWLRCQAASDFDVAIIQRELISTIPSFEGFLRSPIIADIDDAIWLYRRGYAAHHLARRSDHIVVGNQHLADYFSQFGRNITIIPTGVDTHRFIPLADPKNRSYGVIGWSGTWGGYNYFKPLLNNLAQILRRNPDWKLRFISDRAPNFPLLPEKQVEFYPWSPSAETLLTADMDIGLMPLDDSLWSLGKCSYKMLLYMACGIPVIASDIGMNHDILRMDNVGLGVRTPDDWQAALETLIMNPELRLRMGRSGRQLVEQRFSLDVVSSQWMNVLANFK